MLLREERRFTFRTSGDPSMCFRGAMSLLFAPVSHEGKKHHAPENTEARQAQERHNHTRRATIIASTILHTFVGINCGLESAHQTLSLQGTLLVGDVKVCAIRSAIKCDAGIAE